MDDFNTVLKKEVEEHEAEREVVDMAAKPSITDHDHHFKLVSGDQAQCDCGWGLFINAAELKDGHIYKDGTLVI